MQTRNVLSQTLAASCEQLMGLWSGESDADLKNTASNRHILARVWQPIKILAAPGELKIHPDLVRRYLALLTGSLKRMRCQVDTGGNEAAGGLSSLYM